MDIPAPVAGGNTPQLDIGKTMLQAADIQRTRAATENIKSETYQRDYQTMSLQLARAAHDIMAQPPGPDRDARWNHHVNQFAERGLISPQDRDYYLKSGPNDLVLNSAIRRGMDVEANMRATGMTDTLSARGAAPYQYHQMDPTVRAGYPAQTLGNLGPQSPPGMIPGHDSQQGPLGAATAPPVQPQPAPAPAAMPPTPAPAAPPAQTYPPGVVPTGGMIPNRPGETNTTIMPGSTPAPAAVAAATPPPQAALTPPNAPQGSESAPAHVPPAAAPYYSEAPAMKAPWPDMKGGPGIVTPGVHPLALKAQEGANEKMEKEILPTAQRAVKTQAELGALVSELERGHVSTDRLAVLKTTLGEYVYALSGDYDLAKKISGTDLSAQEMARKIMTTRGLKFDRETEGARMALMAIQIGNKANPEMTTSEAGNLKMAKYLIAGAKYDVETANAAQGYMMKQYDTSGTAHLIGFEQHWNVTHPAMQYISREVPLTLPRSSDGKSVDTAGMMKNVTYEFNTKDGKSIRGIWDGNKLVPQ